MGTTPQGYKYGIEPNTTHPFWSEGGGEVVDINATASVDDTTGTPSVTVTKTEETDAVNFDFAFTGIKGEKGEKGDTGEKGADGAAGAAGEKGADGITPEITITASVDNTSGSPAVTVTKGGTSEQPTFDLAFTGLKGKDGEGSGTTEVPLFSIRPMNANFWNWGMLNLEGSGTISQIIAAVAGTSKEVIVPLHQNNISTTGVYMLDESDGTKADSATVCMKNIWLYQGVELPMATALCIAPETLTGDTAFNFEAEDVGVSIVDTAVNGTTYTAGTATPISTAKMQMVHSADTTTIDLTIDRYSIYNGTVVKTFFGEGLSLGDLTDTKFNYYTWVEE